MKRFLFICVILMITCLGMNAQETEKALSGSKYLKGLKGSYVELFSQETCLNAKYDNNEDEFRYFWFMPDSPKTTYHIEFRYGSDKAQLSQMMEGKYAFWMAAGVREGHEDEWLNGITLFVEERLKGK